MAPHGRRPGRRPEHPCSGRELCSQREVAPLLGVLVQADGHFEPKDYPEEETSARFLQAPLAPLLVVFVLLVPLFEDFREIDEKKTTRRRRRHVEALGLGGARRRRPCCSGGRTAQADGGPRRPLGAAWNSGAPACAGGLGEKNMRLSV